VDEAGRIEGFIQAHDIDQMVGDERSLCGRGLGGTDV
jgi:hypothetical protein